jgi:hypothetical protein
VDILATLSPISKRLSTKVDGTALRPKIQVVIKLVMAVIPFAVKEGTVSPIKDVVFENETGVIFVVGPSELGILAQREDIVANDVVATIILMKASVLSAVNNVVFDKNIAAALVSVDALTAVSMLIA